MRDDGRQQRQPTRRSRVLETGVAEGFRRLPLWRGNERLQEAIRRLAAECGEVIGPVMCPHRDSSSPRRLP
jgi:hypothetical protein